MQRNGSDLVEPAPRKYRCTRKGKLFANCRVAEYLSLPRWAVEVALTIYYCEAVLACLAIIIWRFNHVSYDPDVCLMNAACLDGDVSQEWLEEEHPLDGEASIETRKSTNKAHGGCFQVAGQCDIHVESSPMKRNGIQQDSTI